MHYGKIKALTGHCSDPISLSTSISTGSEAKQPVGTTCDGENFLASNFGNGGELAKL
jgi:hypothetical protein